MVKKIIANKAQCNKCKDIIESNEPNSLKNCLCGSIGVDGGLDYIKRIGNSEDIIELSEYSKEFNTVSSLDKKVISQYDIAMQNLPNQLKKYDNFQSIINVSNNLNSILSNNIVLQLQKINTSFFSTIFPNYLVTSQRLFEQIRPNISYTAEIMSKSLSNIVNQLNPMQQIAKSISDALKPITMQLTDSLPKMSSYFGELSRTLEKIKENPDSMLNWMEYSNKLSEYIWTIPYQISSEELKYLTENVDSEKEFDKYMLKYFTKVKVESLFLDIMSRLNRKHKTIMKQIKEAYFSKNYALANVGILSVIDELCSQFLLDRGCVKRQNILLPIIEELDENSNDPFEVLPIMILNDNINVIYESVDFNKKIKIKTNKKIRRNPSQHGQSFSNRKIDALMLLNTVYYLLITMENYKQYIGKIIYVKNQKELLNADASYSNDIKRFYIKKKYIRKRQ